MELSEDEKARLKSIDTTKYVTKSKVKTESRVLRAGFTDAQLQERFNKLHNKDLSPDERLRLGIKRNMEVLEKHVQEQEKKKNLTEQKDTAPKKPSAQAQADSTPTEDSAPKNNRFEMNFEDLLGGLTPQTNDKES